MMFRAILSRRAALLGLTGAVASGPRQAAAEAFNTAAEASNAAAEAFNAAAEASNAAAEVSKAAAEAQKVTAQGGACRLTPQTVEGPFYLDPKLVRSDIREDRPGLPLGLRLRVIEAGACTPIRDARVDVWHADAQGLYSGYDRQGDQRRVSTKGRTFLRGTQASDADGWVDFRTIYPGWYAGRATHVHFRVFVDARTLVTGQMYFPESVNAEVYGNALYGGRGSARDTLNASDWIAQHDDPAQIGLCTVETRDEARVATLVIGVDRLGPPKSGFWPF